MTCERCGKDARLLYVTSRGQWCEGCVDTTNGIVMAGFSIAVLLAVAVVVWINW